MITATPSKPFAAVPAWAFLGLMAAAYPAEGQVITDTANSTLVGAVAFGILLPGRTTAVTPGQIQFRLRSTNATGYRVDATATFAPTTSGAVSGGTTIAASDIGVGITSVATSLIVITPRTDTILSGFGYDPTAVVAATGVTPYLGAAAGQATLADLAVNKKILSGPQIAVTQGFFLPNYLTVTMKFGLLPQYFTPGSFTSIITMTISAGP